MLGGMKQYPADFRDRLLRAIDAGLARAEAARRFGVSERTLSRWARQRRESGAVAPKPRPGRARRIGPAQAPRLVARVRAHPDATLAEHCAAFERVTGVRVSPATMSRALAKLGLTLKKRRCSPGSATRRSGRPGEPRRRRSSRPTWSSWTRPPRPPR